jgi:hypothetical protein
MWCVVQIIFVRSFSDSQKVELLNAALAVLYTPENEHFGIVPIEGVCLVHTPCLCASADVQLHLCFVTQRCISNAR